MVENTKFLGIQIDSFLNWSNHIQYIRGKIARGVGIICKARKYLNESTLVTLYYCFVYPYLSYCIDVWGSTYRSYLTALDKLNKKAIRLITNSPRNAHTYPLFRKLKILNLANLYSYSVQLFMYKFYHLHLPDIFHQFFIQNDEIYSYNTRQRQCYHVVRPKTDIIQRTIKYVGAKRHNYFIHILSYNSSIYCYKKSVKQHILENSDIVYG